MTFDNFENVFSLICVTMGLTYCVFRYIDTPRRGYAYIIGFFMANFLGEYYWTIYVLVTHSYPDVSEFVSYLGWNMAIVFLLLAVITLRRPEARRYFHPLILLPVVLNIPQFMLYISFGSLLNNLWQVGITTATAVLCMQELVYYLKFRNDRKRFPLFFLVVVLYLLTKYVMWTASCFEWTSDLLSPYLYCSVLSSIACVLFPYGASFCYETKVSGEEALNAVDQRFRVLIQTILCLVVFGMAAGGFFVAAALGGYGMERTATADNDKYIGFVLFLVSVLIAVLVMLPVFVIPSRFRSRLTNIKFMDKWGKSRINFIYTLIVTLILMAGLVIYNNVVLYNSSVVGVYESGDNVLDAMAIDIENYLTKAETTLSVAAGSVDSMIKNGSSIQDVSRYLTEQTELQSEQLDENFTGLYACINGEFMDGSGWIPPEGYDPESRDWYRAAIAAGGKTVIVKPYIDAHTGSIVITFARSVSDISGKDRNYGVIGLDVIFNHVKEVAETVEVAGKGYGIVINNDGFIIAHKNEEYNGSTIADLYGKDLLDRIQSTKTGRLDEILDNKEYVLFVRPVLDQWYALVVIDKTELLENTYSKLAVSVMLSIFILGFITVFYYLGYKNEQISGSKVERLNLQVVSALASAIDAKDTYTNGHSTRVAEYARMIAQRAGCSDSEQEEIYMMGLLHDVGKIGVPDEVINKTARLTDEEYELIKKHPVIGSEILDRIKERPELATGARWHHERFDGRGYPDGIAGDEIPKEARMIAVADAYDAMTSTRSYRGVMPQEKVRAEIEKGIGTQFDPQFAKLMIEMIDEDTEYRMREK